MDGALARMVFGKEKNSVALRSIVQLLDMNPLAMETVLPSLLARESNSQEHTLFAAI